MDNMKEIIHKLATDQKITEEELMSLVAKIMSIKSKNKLKGWYKISNN